MCIDNSVLNIDISAKFYIIDFKGGDLMQDKFLIELENEGFYFKYAKGDSSRNGKEFHLFYEIILFLGGKAELISETVNLTLKPNTLVVIPKETYHQVKILGDPDDYLRCIINFHENGTTLTDDRFKRIGVYNFSTDLEHLFDTLIAIAQNNQDVSPTLPNSLLDVILYEILQQRQITAAKTLSDTTLCAIRFVENNIQNEITVGKVALACRVSVSTLAHTFKDEMNISVYKYTLQKKLLAAHDKIVSGVPTTVAAIECGFNDYSGFYKQYKKMFGFSPSIR